MSREDISNIRVDVQHQMMELREEFLEPALIEATEDHRDALWDEFMGIPVKYVDAPIGGPNVCPKAKYEDSWDRIKDPQILREARNAELYSSALLGQRDDKRTELIRRDALLGFELAQELADKEGISWRVHKNQDQ